MKKQISLKVTALNEIKRIKINLFYRYSYFIYWVFLMLELILQLSVRNNLEGILRFFNFYAFSILQFEPRGTI